MTSSQFPIYKENFWKCMPDILSVTTPRIQSHSTSIISAKYSDIKE